MWDNGENVIIAWLYESDSHKKFLREFVGKNPRQFNNYWKNRLFIGKAHMVPKPFKNEVSLIRYVSETKGAIGYVSSFKSPKNVKTISIK